MRFDGHMRGHKGHPLTYQFHELPGGYPEGTHALCMTGGNGRMPEQFLIDQEKEAETEAAGNVTKNR